MVERHDRPAEKPEGDDSRAPKIEVSPPTVAETRASTTAMDESRRRGAEPAMRHIDGGNAPTIVDSPPGGSTERRHGEPPPERERFTKHKVGSGETVWSIVEARQTDPGHKPSQQEIMRGVEQVMQANPRLRDERRLREGQELKIPEDINSGIRPTGRQIPGAPTALVIDNFNGNGTQGGIADTSHGGFLAKGFNAMGFNTLKSDLSTEIKDVNPRLGRGDYSRPMERAADYIERNPEQFPPGSFVNTSFGNNKAGNPDKRAGDPTYKELSGLLKLNVTPESIGSQKDEILTRLGRVAQGRNPETDQPDATIKKEDRAMADAAVRTNAQIERIQKLGVEVIHSAGNDGKDKVDINFLRATNLRADGPDGKLLGFSATGSHTEHGAGLYKFHQINKDEVATIVNGVTVTFPINKGALHDRRDHVIKPAAFDDPKHRAEPFVAASRKNPERFDVEAYKRGYEQRVYNIGNAVDYVPGTSFSPFSYVARTRQVARPPEP